MFLQALPVLFPFPLATPIHLKPFRNCSVSVSLPFPHRKYRLLIRYPITGVNVYIKDYGGVQGVDYMDSGHTMGMWNDTIAVLTSLGYEIGTCLAFSSLTTKHTHCFTLNRQKYQSGPI